MKKQIKLKNVYKTVKISHQNVPSNAFKYDLII